MKLSKIVEKLKVKNDHKKEVKKIPTRTFITINDKEHFEVQEYHNPLLGISRD